MKIEVMNTKLLGLPMPSVTVAIPCPYLDASEIRCLCGVERKREFIQHTTTGGYRFEEEKTWPYKGSFKTWFKLENHAYITSYAVVTSDVVKIVQPHLGDPVIRYAPSGMAFAVDGNGVYVIRLSDGMDFHPGHSVWRVKNFATFIRERMAENFKLRQDQRKAEKRQALNKRESERLESQFKRGLHSVWVTLDDSWRAGNCVEGTLAWCERKLKLAREDILAARWLVSEPADKLIRIANGDLSRVMPAIKQAWFRLTEVSI